MGLRAAAYVCMGMCISTVAAIRISDRFSQLLRNVCTQTEAHSGELISTSVMMLLALFHKKLILNFQNQESSYTRTLLMFTQQTMAHDCTWNPSILTATEFWWSTVSRPCVSHGGIRKQKPPICYIGAGMPSVSQGSPVRASRRLLEHWQ